MRRPDIELSDEAAAFVERHPDLVENLAGRADETAPEADALRVGVRARIREKLAAFDPDQARTAGQAFLARYGI